MVSMNTLTAEPTRPALRIEWAASVANRVIASARSSRRRTSVPKDRETIVVRLGWGMFSKPMQSSPRSARTVRSPLTPISLRTQASGRRERSRAVLTPLRSSLRVNCLPIPQTSPTWVSSSALSRHGRAGEVENPLRPGGGSSRACWLSWQASWSRRCRRRRASRSTGALSFSPLGRNP